MGMIVIGCIISIARGFELVYQVSEIYNHTSSNRLITVDTILRIRFRTGNLLLKKLSVEPFIEHIQDVFKIDPLPIIRRRQKATGIVTLSVLLYQIIVYYNCKTRKECQKQSFTC